jgi:hypothetical protein
MSLAPGISFIQIEDSVSLEDFDIDVSDKERKTRMEYGITSPALRSGYGSDL